MTAIVKILLTCVKIYLIWGKTYRVNGLAKNRFGALYDGHMEEMSV